LQPDELLPLTGSFIAFPATKAAREQEHDPRQSIEERYGSRGQYEALVTDAATKLVQQRYLLSEDVLPVVKEAMGKWDELTRGTALVGK
jgi:Alpha/beta hydrolase domain